MKVPNLSEHIDTGEFESSQPSLIGRISPWPVKIKVFDARADMEAAEITFLCRVQTGEEFIARLRLAERESVGVP